MNILNTSHFRKFVDMRMQVHVVLQVVSRTFNYNFFGIGIYES